MFAVLILAATGLILATPAPALALPCCADSIVYFEDCSYTNVVGWEATDCSGQHSQSGTTSGPYYFSKEWCGNPSCCADPPCDYACQAENHYGGCSS
jgi:hypothetical protein